VAALVIFPFAVTMEYNTSRLQRVLHRARFMVLLASVFACFGLLSILGLTMLAVPRRYLRGASLIVRIASALGLVAILGSAFSVPRLLLSNRPPDYLSYIPSVWFLELHQGMLARGALTQTGTAVLALQVTAAAFVVALSHMQ
jgi:hypothetical protein